MKKFLLLLLTLMGPIFTDEIDLSGYEKLLYSKHGEDGIISRIFQFIEPKHKFCLDIGAGDGITSSNTYLLRLQGWNCSLFDRTHEKIPFKLYKEFITAENLNEILKKYNVPTGIDFMSIDHYNEFYIWHSLDEKYRPAVVAIKYNATHGPDQDLVAKYRPFFIGDGTNYFGASILAMYRLGRSKGYSLVYAESIGMTLFFIRDDILEEKKLHFKNMNDVEKIYRFAAYGNGPNGGYRQDPKARAYISSSDVLR
ncbi:MAG: hypothetical protein K1X28_05455 [Parachlamydiales bacterium]|nr:hypothetical protein [Parachlamydiales bacterium]